MPSMFTLISGATLTDVGTAVSPARPGCIVCPGGGYTHLSDKEGAPVAQWLESLGIRAFVLAYRVNTRHPAPLEDAQAAIRLVRANADAWGVEPYAVGILGFGAGGHLAAMLSTHWVDRTERPDFAVLIYPVITMKDPLAHKGSRTALLGAKPDSALIEDLSNETKVTAETPSTFIVAGADDALVPIGNSLAYATSMSIFKVPFELHVVQHMGQGSVWGETGSPQDWRPAAAIWLQTLIDLLQPSAPARAFKKMAKIFGKTPGPVVRA
ncbi:esterase/lipase-like protein [Auriculariales sp. MPI-PUGE-AT-0066]|nr:esterase/lipase-like protein [Auriculariales sp. MPI-PUGE-AT-0066]